MRAKLKDIDDSHYTVVTTSEPADPPSLSLPSSLAVNG